LWKTFGENMTVAFLFMSSDNRKHCFELTSNQYDKLKSDFCKKMKLKNKGKGNPMYGKPGGMLGKKQTKEAIFTLSESLKGHKVSEETKNKISKKIKGRKHSEETKKAYSENRKKEKNSFYGKHHSEETKEKVRKTKKMNYVKRCWINNEEKEILIPEKELKNYLEKGYTKGRKLGVMKNRKKQAPLSKEHRDKLSEAFTGLKWVNNGFINKRVSKDIAKELVNQSYSYGRISWKK